MFHTAGTLITDVKYALRWLRRSPAFAAVAIASLAVGIGFNTAIFSLVDEVLFRPLPVERSDQLVDVFTSGPDGDPYSTSSYPDFLDLKRENRVFKDMIAFSLSLDAIKLTDRSRLAMGEVVTGNYFDVLGVKAHIGRTLLPDDDRAVAPRAAVLSYALWTREFGASADALGRIIRIHGQRYTIVGVAPRTFRGLLPLVSPEVWTPMAFVDDVQPGGIINVVPSPTGTTKLERRGERWLFVKGRLADGETVERAAANLQTIMGQLASAFPQTNKDRRAAAVRTDDVHIVPAADRVLRPVAAGLMFVVGLVLLVACANVASMLLARASGRQKEIGIRLAIGAGRARVVRQLLTESAVVGLLGAGAGLVLAWAITRVIASIHPPIPIPITVALDIDRRVLAFTVLVSIAAGLVAGLVPALRATRPGIVHELKGEVAAARLGGRRWTIGDALVAAQIAVSLVLLVVGGLLARSLVAAQRTALGFEAERLVVVSLEMGLSGYSDAQAQRFYQDALVRIRAIPGVDAVSLVERTPFSINYSRNMIFLPDRHQAGDKGITVAVTRVAPEYFETLGVPLLEGRTFTTADTPESPRVAIVNETMARQFWPQQPAIGKRFRARTIDGPLVEVIGVVADYKVSTVGEPPTPYIHYACSQAPDPGESILARTRGDAASVLAAMRRELLTLEPNATVLENQTMTTQVSATLMPARLGAITVSVVGALAMILAAVGLYGAVAYSVGRRTREIGIRMALGASRGSVLALIMRQGLAVALVGVGAGAVFGLAAARLTASALYDVSFADPVAWTVAPLVVIAVAAAANLAPAARAARVNPSVALRSE